MCNKIETPYTDHLSQADFECIYEPAEDTFLLLDALEADLEFLLQLQPRVCVEIGAGSGVIITALAKQLKNAMCLATDINALACVASKRTAQRNAATNLVDCLQCNLLDMLRAQSVDLLVFNPPYVVTSDEELQGKQHQSALTYAWAGGKDGRRIIDELLQKLPGILAPAGICYLLLLRENKPEQVMAQLMAQGFEAVKFMQRRIPGEDLCIIKIKKL